MKKNIVPIRSSTQKFIEIEDIDKNIVMFSDGSCVVVLSIKSVNFELLSEREQEALIYAYAGFLNSLSFPIQILVRTQRKDISSYLHQLEEQEKNQKNPKLQASIRSYRIFVSRMVRERNVLDKKFYIIIPLSSVELGKSPSLIFGTKQRGLPYPKDYIFEKALNILTPKSDQIIRLAGRMGLKARQLTTDQLIELFFSIYNPETPLPEKSKIEELTQKP